MKYFPRSTQVPNDIFDYHLSELNVSSLKVLLVIIRQTIGYVNTHTGNRKITDWISVRFFMNKTGLTRKSITQALSFLIHKNIIIAFDGSERELKTAKDRRGKKRIYYAYKAFYLIEQHKTCVKKTPYKSKIPPYTKLTDTKKENSFLRKSDAERLKEIFENGA